MSVCTVPPERDELFAQLFDPASRAFLHGRIPADASVLAMGMGHGGGELAQWMARQCPEGHVLACDGDAAAVERARARSSARGTALRFEVAEPFALGATQRDHEGYDLVYARDLLHRIKDMAGALRALHGCVRPGGYLVVHEPGTLLPASAIAHVDTAQLPQAIALAYQCATGRPADCADAVIATAVCQGWPIEEIEFAAPRGAPALTAAFFRAHAQELIERLVRIGALEGRRAATLHERLADDVTAWNLAFSGPLFALIAIRKPG